MRPGPSIRFCWNLWTHFCGIGFDWDDEGLTFHMAFPPVAFWLEFDSNFWLVDKIAPRETISQHYGTPPRDPDYLVIKDRECAVSIHSGRVWIRPWTTKMSWTKTDAWYRRGVSFSINPFEWTFQQHEVRCSGGEWKVVPKARLGTLTGKEPIAEKFQYPYKYVLKNGTVQDRIATVSIERRAWRPRCLQWTSLFEKARTSLDINFDDEVGEKTGSWKGGCIGCGWDIQSGESIEQALRRMESTRKF